MAMNPRQELIARIQRDCLPAESDPEKLNSLMRNPVRRLLSYTGAVTQLHIPGRPTLIVGFDMAPGLLRALQLVDQVLDWTTAPFSEGADGVTLIPSDKLLLLDFGPRLRSLAAGHLVLSRHTDSTTLTRSLFVFIGIRPGTTDELLKNTKVILPCLHRTFLRHFHKRNDIAFGLTRAELEICRLLVHGQTNRRMAQTLGKSEATVRNQLHALFVKMQVHTRTEALAKLGDYILPVREKRTAGGRR